MKDTPAQVISRGCGSSDRAAFGSSRLLVSAERSLIWAAQRGFSAGGQARPAHQNFCVRRGTRTSRGDLVSQGARWAMFVTRLHVEQAIRFRGGVIFVTHDERLIELVADELWVVNKGVGGQPGSVDVWHSSYEEYKEKLQNEFVNAGLVTNGTVKGLG